MRACLRERRVETAGADRSIRPARSCELALVLVHHHGRAGSTVHRILGGSGYSTDRTWAHTTIIPTNSVIDASAAASSTTARIMMHPLMFEHKGNLVHGMFPVNS